MLFWDEEKKTITTTTNIWNDDRMNYEPKTEVYSVDSNPLRNELNEFVECVTHNKQPRSDIYNAIDVAENLDLLFKSFSHN